jgi:hypothetical protein
MSCPISSGSQPIDSKFDRRLDLSKHPHERALHGNNAEAMRIDAGIMLMTNQEHPVRNLDRGELQGTLTRALSRVCVQ